MALAPEFFVLLGITIFLAVSVITALLERYLPSILPFLFQGAAGAGLAELLLSTGLAGATRVWAGIVYLAFALSSLVGVNIRLAIVRRGMNIASILSQMVTVPVVMISALFLSSFLENGGNLVFTLGSIGIIVFAVLVANLSIFGLLREYSRQGRVKSGGLVSLPTGQAQLSTAHVISGLEPPASSTSGFGLRRRSDQDEEWEEAPVKES